MRRQTSFVEWLGSSFGKARLMNSQSFVRQLAQRSARHQIICWQGVFVLVGFEEPCAGLTWLPRISELKTARPDLSGQLTFQNLLGSWQWEKHQNSPAGHLRTQTHQTPLPQQARANAAARLLKRS